MIVETYLIVLGSANRIFKKELDLNLEMTLQSSYKQLNLLMKKRNVIVHNAGIADLEFKSTSGLDIKLGNRIPVEYDEIINDIDLVKNVAQKLNEELWIEIKEEKINKLESYVRKELENNEVN